MCQCQSVSRNVGAKVVNVMVLDAARKPLQPGGNVQKRRSVDGRVPQIPLLLSAQVSAIVHVLHVK